MPSLWKVLLLVPVMGMMAVLGCSKTSLLTTVFIWEMNNESIMFLRVEDNPNHCMIVVAAVAWDKETTVDVSIEPSDSLWTNEPKVILRISGFQPVKLPNCHGFYIVQQSKVWYYDISINQEAMSQLGAWASSQGVPAELNGDGRIVFSLMKEKEYLAQKELLALSPTIMPKQKKQMTGKELL